LPDKPQHSVNDTRKRWFGAAWIRPEQAPAVAEKVRRLLGGYYGHGWGSAWSAAEIRTDTIIIVETLVYSLRQNKLVWGGQSKTTLLQI
jgi:hypothetical protein